MSNFIRRLERLERHNHTQDGPTVFLFSWISDEMTTRATYGENELLRIDGEADNDFYQRAEAWAKTLPGNRQERMVWLEGHSS
jgi:hypothetical protein